MTLQTGTPGETPGDRARRERERWQFLLEFLKVVAGLSGGVLAILAAIFSDPTKIPNDASRFILLGSAALTTISLAAAIAAIIALNNYILQFETAAPEVTRRRGRKVIYLTNVSQITWGVAGVAFFGFIVARTALTSAPPQQGSAISLPGGAPAKTAGAIPPDCVALQVDAAGSASCAQRRDGEGRGATDRTFVILPAKRFDLVASIAEAIRNPTSTGTDFSPIALARDAAARLARAMADELGKKLVDSMFSADGGADPINPTAQKLTIVPAREAGPEIERRQLDIYPFKTGNDVVPDQASWLARLATVASYPAGRECRVEITGFGDRRGSAPYNLYLSMRRATAVERLLIDLGVSRADLRVRAAGAFGNGCETDTSPDLACNRHVEVVRTCR